MKTGLALMMLLAFATTPGLAMTVYLDYDQEYDFSKSRTYQWVAPTTPDRDPAIRQMITDAIKKELGARGLQEVQSDPQIFVTFNSNAREESVLNDTDIVPNTWYGHSNYGSATTQIKTYRVGTLIIDATDAKTKKLIWRAVAEDTVKPDPDKVEGKIAQALKKIGKEWDQRKKDSARAGAAKK